MPALDYLASDGVMGACALDASAPPQEMISGGDGSLWILEAGDGVIDHFTLQGDAIRYPLSSIAPAHMAIGPDTNLWFTLPGNDAIGRLDPSGDVDQFSLPPAEGAPEAITSGDDGALWFTEQGNRIGRISTDGTNVRGFNLPQRTPWDWPGSPPTRWRCLVQRKPCQ